VGSEGGGLPEAIGPCGPTFPNGDANALADAIDRLLSTPALLATFRSAASTHLAAHTPAAAASAYLQLFESAILKPEDKK
jgi:glycosyltransferase involved in cell wall biosynthesis